MRFSSLSQRRKAPGYALVMVMISVALLLVIFATTLFWASTNARITVRNNLFNVSEAAAESSTENIMTYMMRDFSYGTLGSASSYNLFPPTNSSWPMAFQWSDTNGNTANAASISIGSSQFTQLNSEYNGLYAFAVPVTVASTAKPLGQGINLSATVGQTIQFAVIPLFQFAIFYNVDMEINPGAVMTVNGPVHSNVHIWATGSSSSAPLTFSNEVEAAQMATNVPSPLDPQNVGRHGNVIYADANSPLSDYASLNLPIGGTTNNNPTNVLGILNLPSSSNAPPNYTSAYSTNGMIYFANASDLIVSNAWNGTNNTKGTNITVYYQNPNNSPNYITQVQGDVPVATNGSGTNAVVVYNYSWVTNSTYYDYRESDTVQAVNIDVGKLNTWLSNSNSRGGAQYNTLNNSGSASKGHSINSIYVLNNVNMTASTLPAVRLVDGQQLPPAGLTVSTPDPLYVLGNYNTTTNGSTFSTTLGDTKNTQPASLLGDSITILSTPWSDSYGTNTTLSSRAAGADTTINAAALEGIVPSNGTNYSGGVENFLRLEQDWSSHTLTYNGSIVVMFPSQHATNAWITPGTYYQAPNRKWGFDTNFMASGRLPPLTPTVKATIRGNWSSW